MKKRKREIKLRYGVIYLHDARVVDWRRVGAVHGATRLLENAIGQAARHVERSLLVDAEYAKAIVYDREEERILFVYSRAAGGVMRKDFRAEHRPV